MAKLQAIRVNGILSWKARAPYQQIFLGSAHEVWFRRSCSPIASVSSTPLPNIIAVVDATPE